MKNLKNKAKVWERNIVFIISTIYVIILLFWEKLFPQTPDLDMIDDLW